MSKIIELLQENAFLTRSEIVDLSELPDRVVSGTLGSLLRKNVIERRMNGSDVVFSLAENVPENDPDDCVGNEHNAISPAPGQTPSPMVGRAVDGSFHLVYHNGTARVIPIHEVEQILEWADAIRKCKSALGLD